MLDFVKSLYLFKPISIIFENILVGYPNSGNRTSIKLLKCNQLQRQSRLLVNIYQNMIVIMFYTRKKALSMNTESSFLYSKIVMETLWMIYFEYNLTGTV